jgi:Protein of unknown function (DUF4038)/Putative collagen-binding domain of a collagenase
LKVRSECYSQTNWQPRLQLKKKHNRNGIEIKKASESNSKYLRSFDLVEDDMASRRQVVVSALRLSAMSLAAGAIALYSRKICGAAMAVTCLPEVSNLEGRNWYTIENQPASPLKFPLSAVKGQGFLRDGEGHPFLIFGDSAWSLLTQLTREEAELYLEDRRHKGFNTLLVNLIEHMYADNAPRNAYGEAPFLPANDFSSPNPLYFDHAEWVLRRAAAKGLMVLLAPAYSGANGGPEGWYKEMAANGPAKLGKYGVYVGGRFKELNNIIWVHNGDYNPPQRELVQAVAAGIRSMQPHALHVAHNAPETSGFDYWSSDELPMQLDTIYTYEPVLKTALRLAKNSNVPYFLIESTYENNPDGSPLRVRSQAWQALLAGAAGQVFGNNPIWHFNAPAIQPQPMNWRMALDSPGTFSSVHLRNLLLSLPWASLEPDIDGEFLIGGALGGHQQAAAALTSDGTAGVIYIPTPRRITINMRKLAGEVTCRWFDPSAGRFLSDTEHRPSNIAARNFEPPVCSVEGDWVLLLSVKKDHTWQNSASEESRP